MHREDKIEYIQTLIDKLFEQEGNPKDTPLFWDSKLKYRFNFKLILFYSQNYGNLTSKIVKIKDFSEADIKLSKNLFKTISNLREENVERIVSFFERAVLNKS